MQTIEWNVEDKIAVAVIHHPPANALSAAVLKDLDALLSEIGARDDIAVVILRGEGRFFSAGADIKEFLSHADKDQADLSRSGQSIFEKVETFPKPVIAAIHGAALGGGLELAMSCHLRYVAENAKLGLPELQLGLIPGFGGTQRLVRHVGPAKAAEMMFTSEPISGVEAVEWGLANRSFREEVLFAEVLTIAKKVASRSPQSLQAVIQLLNTAKGADFSEKVSEEARLFGEVFATEDAKEGITAFVEKRPPIFTGK